MKVIIAGTRTCTDYSLLESAIKESRLLITMVLYGGAKGADTLGKQWAIKNDVLYDTYLPNWERYGNHAGNLRNIDMGKQADALIALWDGRSTGTKHMIETMEQYEKRIFIKRIPITRKSIKKSSEKHPKTGFFT